MKSFSIEWWIYMQGVCYENAMHEMYKCNQMEADEWRLKAQWIGKRIIKKYENLSENYYDLLMSVESKYKDESRHETALKYIKQGERKGGKTNTV